jgi:hypothetical protein
MKLNPEELDVTSFDTTAPGAEASAVFQPIRPTTDPTEATRCFICPAETYNYCY